MNPKPTHLRDLFRQTKPYRTGDLKVSKLHTIHFEECGNPRGKPLVFLHGGPGGGIERALFGERRQLQAAGAGASDEHLAEELAFGLVHAHVDREDFVGAPVGHAAPDEHRAAAQLVRRCTEAGHELCGCAVQRRTASRTPSAARRCAVAIARFTLSRALAGGSPSAAW